MSVNITPISINPKALFAPLNGETYTRRDAERCFAQQPFPLIPKYLWFHNNKAHKPPTLYYGCIIKKRQLLKIVCRHFRHCVIWVDERGEDLEDELDDSESDTDSKTETTQGGLFPHDFDTLLSDSLTDALAERFNLPGSGVLSVQVFATPEGGTKFGIALGSNEVGVVPIRSHAAILEFFGFGPDAKPQWHLDPLRWCWTRMNLSDNA
ncbi:hypothetical protein OF83DRAFT_1085970 [Amylostereum chailletii]|nr:hypothetical protein OF83DRAFT_1085970 [Amylostereum chailletii]